MRLLLLVGILGLVTPVWGEEPVRYRGANLTCADETTLTAEDVARWKRWGINLIRINFNKDYLANAYSDPPTDRDPWKPYVRNRAKLGLWLGWLRAQHLDVMISLDALWGDDHNSRSLWQNQGRNPYLDHRIALTKALARWLASDWPEVRYLEPWNEPHPYDALYEPHTYTHQGLYGQPRLTQGWPGTFRDYPDGPASYVDRAAAAAFCSDLAAFQRRTGKRVFISEFGVVRWAVGSDRYLADLIAVFEEAGFDWVFHSIAGWNGWNPTFAPDAPQTTANFGTEHTPAFPVLQAAWSKNQTEALQ